MKIRTTVAKASLLVLTLGAGYCAAGSPGLDYRVQPVPIKKVRIADGFWADRIETNRLVTIGYCFQKCEETGRIDNFAIAGGLKQDRHRGHYFNDSDVFKVIEGASYSLMAYPDEDLEKYIDKLIAKIAAAQEKDGYLYTVRTIDPNNVPRHSGPQRWSNLRYSHELYNLGHLHEAAAAHYEATGKHNLLDVAIKSAKLVAETFGPNNKRDIGGHEEIEIGLVKLYRLTGDRKYLDTAKFFIDERGHYNLRESYKAFRQDHEPVTQQTEAVGHAVSGAYLYAGMADVAALTGDADYVAAIDRMWQSVVSKRLYITGVAAANGEKFSDDFRLPNLKGYNETCAAIALAMWNHRMFLLHGQARYIDMLERSLYNGVISGVSLTGDSFFYSNPLASDGKHKFNGVDIPDDEMTASRMDWFICACCPSNIVRIIPSIRRYAYAVSGDTVYVNLFVAGEATVRTTNNTVRLRVATRYPWEGTVKITVEPEKAGRFTLNLRIPGWVQNRPVPSDLYRYLKVSSQKVALKVNGRAVKLDIEKGFEQVSRHWRKGDVVELHLPMQVRRVVCDERVEANRGKVALERGPIVYCVEWFDNGGKASHLAVYDDDQFDVEYHKDMLGGINVIKREGETLVAIPYYAWAHRGEGEMAVWLNRKVGPKILGKKIRHGITVSEAPASWKQALPCGNGSVGAMAYGDPRNETILLNHEALFYPLWPKSRNVPNMAQYLPKLREMIAEGQYKLAEKFWNEKLKEHDYGGRRSPFTNPYHPACDLVIQRQGETREIEDYRQRLDFERAEVIATWKQGDAEYERRMFVSRADDVVAVWLRSTTPQAISAKIGLVPHQPQTDIHPIRMGRNRDYLLSRKAYEGDPIKYENGLSDDDLILRGKYWDGREFGAVGRVIADHQRIDHGKGFIDVPGSQWVLVLVKLFANERDWNVTVARLRSQLRQLSRNYETLLQRHTGEHNKLFGRMRLNLQAPEARGMSNAELLELAAAGEMPVALVERLFEFGRYLLICSSRPGGLPANLQGVWSGTWTPSWSCDYTINENVQMAYWQALPGNMPEVTGAYFDYFDSLIPDWQTNAKQFWGCRGIASYLRHSDHGLIVQYAPWQFWTAGCGWLAQLYYDYYLFTGDRGFLKERAVPFMREVALFYEDFVLEDGDGTCVFSPSMSPENRPGNSTSLATMNATMDIAIAKEVLGNLVTACETLGIEQDGIGRWRKMLGKMPEYQINADGVIKEWLHPAFENSDGHRHLSHLYLVFPGFEIDSDEGDAGLRQACRRLLDRKFDSENRKLAEGASVFGWSYAHLANCFARLGHGEKALASLRGVAATCSDKNLLSLFEPPDGPFQIDGNCGFSSAVLEMLLYSRPGVVRLLPALPREWKKGSAKHMLSRSGVEVSIDWDMTAGKLDVVFESPRDQTIAVKLPEPFSELSAGKADGASCRRLSKKPQYWSVTLPAGKDVLLQAKHGLERKEEQ